MIISEKIAGDLKTYLFPIRVHSNEAKSNTNEWMNAILTDTISK